MKHKIDGQFVPLTETLLRSKAWRTATSDTHVRRFVDFLMLEHLRHGGQENGKLKAPWRQLADFETGACISDHFIADTIEKAIALGITDVRRGDRRRASTYGLTWLPLYDGTPPSNRFTECDAAADGIIEAAKEAKRRSTSRRGDKLIMPTQMAGKILPTQMAGTPAYANGRHNSNYAYANGRHNPPNFAPANSRHSIEALPGAEQDKKGSKEGSVEPEGRAVAVGADAPAACPVAACRCFMSQFLPLHQNTV